MRKKLSPQGRNGFAILAMIGCTLLAAAIAPFFWSAAVERELAENRSELGFLKNKLENRKPARNSELTNADNIGSMYFDAKTEGLSLAAFQTLVGKLAVENNMRIERVQPLQSDRRESLQTLKLDVVSQGTTEGLRGFALMLEQARPFIFVREARIGIETETEITASPELTISLHLEAYARPMVTQ